MDVEDGGTTWTGIHVAAERPAEKDDITSVDVRGSSSAARVLAGS
jgi:photosystem II stability/assembly factor-like uncharacterized protein